MYIYTSNEIKTIDQQAELQGLSVETLMENAGRSLYETIKKHVNRNQNILILAGRGNNGGDGIVLARYLKQDGYQVNLVFPFGLPRTKAALKHFLYFQSCGFNLDEITLDKHYDVIVDTLFGIGTKLPLKDEAKKVIKWINEQKSFVISVDLPSGVQADSGESDEAVFADVTFCLQGYKPSAFLLPSLNYYGEIKVLSIGLQQKSHWKIWTKEDVKKTWPQYDRTSHKGSFGTGYILAGSDEMPGSAVLAAKGALRAGIGKLIVGSSRFAVSIIAGQVPEATYQIDGLKKVSNGHVPEKIQACAIGPGIENKELIESALNKLYTLNCPLVLDAGALQKRNYPKNRKDPIILTPHPGEFSRMIEVPIKQIQQNRIILASQFAQKEQVILVLKGHYTVIAFPDGTGVVNLTGNPALAKGGSGDTLTGMITAFLSTHDDVKAAVCNAVYFHGLCSDEWVKEYSERSMIASDIIKYLPIVMKQITSR